MAGPPTKTPPPPRPRSHSQGAHRATGQAQGDLPGPHLRRQGASEEALRREHLGVNWNGSRSSLIFCGGSCPPSTFEVVLKKQTKRGMCQNRKWTPFLKGVPLAFL